MSQEEEIAKRLKETGFPIDPKGLARIVYAYILGERERCAKECELVSQDWSKNNDEYKAVALMCAEQIRTGKH